MPRPLPINRTLLGCRNWFGLFNNNINPSPKQCVIPLFFKVSNEAD